MPLTLRADAAELLDGDRLSRAEVARNLADLARLNRLPGGTGTSVDGIRRLLDGRRTATILDAGTGCGDMPIAFARVGWDTTALDTHPDVLLVARRLTADVARIRVVEADARDLPFVATAISVMAFGRSRVTRNDGLISARRAYTLSELNRLLDGAGLAVRWQSPRWMPRVVTAAAP